MHRPPLKLCFILAILLSSVIDHTQAQTITWGNSGGSTAWYTANNWTPSTAAGAWTTSNIAQFANAGNATTAGINMNTAALSIGAIEITSARTRALTIGNSSPTAGTLTLNGATVNAVSNVILRNASGSILTLQNNETGTGKIMNLSLGSTTNNVVSLDGAGDIVISSLIQSASGTTPLTVRASSTGILQITGTANTFTGNISINGGEARFTADGSLGNAANDIIIDGGIFSNAATFTLGAGRVISVGDGAGTAINVTTGSLTSNNGIINKSGETGSWAKNGSGTLILGGASTYTGTTAIQNGSVQLTTGNDRLPTTTVVSLGQTSSANLGSLDLNGFSQEIAGLNSITGTNATASRNIVTSTGAATLTINNTADYIFSTNSASNSGNITGDISLVKKGGGKQTLGGANTFTGTTTVEAGTLEISTASSLGATTGAVTVSGGTLNLGGSTLTKGVIEVSSGTLSNGTLTGTSYALTNTGTISATLAGTGALTKTGSGIATLSGPNIYSGGTTISAGTLNVTNTSGSATGTGALTLDSTGTLSGTGIIAPASNTDITLNGSLIVGNSTLGSPVASSITLATSGTGVTNTSTTSFFYFDLFTRIGGANPLGSAADYITLPGTLNNTSVGPNLGTIVITNRTGGTTFSLGDSWHLFDFQGTGSITDDFNVDATDLLLSPGLIGQFDRLSGTFSIVPEPSRTLFLALGLLTLTLRRRR